MTELSEISTFASVFSALNLCPTASVESVSTKRVQARRSAEFDVRLTKRKPPKKIAAAFRLFRC